MNICVVNLRENNPYIGGVERVTHVLGHDWLKKGYNVIFLSQYKSSIEKNYVSFCPEYFLPDEMEAFSKDNVNYVVDLLNEKHIDIIINQGSVFPELCELCKRVKSITGIKLITTIHYAPLCKVADIENSFFIREKLGSNLRKWVIDIALYLRYHLYKKRTLINEEKKDMLDIVSYSDRIVCLSESFIPTFNSLLNKSFQTKLVAIPNPVQMEVEHIYTKKKQVLYVGRLEFGLKRVDRLIKMWAKTEKLFPDWDFYIVGDGQVRLSFERMAQKKGLKRIHFEGFQRPDKYYKDSSIICLASSSEGFGMVLVEGLKYQCIPIAYNSFSALSDIIVDDVNGYCIPPFNEDIYLEKMHFLMKNKEARERLSANCTVTLDKFDLEIISKQWLDLFDRLLK